MDSFVNSLMDTLGPFGIALLMFLENIFPPIPSELIMPLAGYEAASGSMSLVSVIVAGTIGSLLGVVPWYYLGLWMGLRRTKGFAARHGRWITMGPQDVETANDWFVRHGSEAVLFGRLVPTVRTLISVPAGIARMPLWKFLVYSAIGSAAWTSFLALGGYWLRSQYELIGGYVGPVSNAVLVLIVVIYLYRVWTFDPARTDTSGAD
ncbi:DedA family protein [Fulvimarina sp. 2208YS6-2-32]|uniref:DedA family protein n=1 Tax=Fulvimarina uroteuthidis TaxID=3098149 RepID=A0ABU5I4F6_9HYPH|nr:DedA family protein [Fulvimarina sp. 2208YS6-2-32]MDY8109975.1 DedA family protein [Fulvimarina sp. 2208YS6-2-32]